MKILVVEDSPPSRALLKKLILRMGHEVTEADNGKQAWDMIKEGTVKMVVSDWIMPEMDGLDLCTRIRGEALNSYVYVIMLTAKDSKQDLVKVFESGADDYIPKPFNPDELRARILTGVRILQLEEDHRKLQRNLIESRNKLSVVFDALQEQIFVLDREFKIISANQAFTKTADCDSRDCNDQNFMGLTAFHANLGIRQDEIQDLLSTVFEKGIVRKRMIHHKDAEGNETYNEVQCLPVKGKEAQVFQIVVVIKDLSEEKRKSKEIHELNNKLINSFADIEQKNEKLKNALKHLEQTQTQMVQSEKMASIGQLAAGVAHEINNPTGFVSSNLRSLTEYQQTFRDVISQCDSIIEKILASEGDKPLPVEIRSACEEVKQFEDRNDVDFLLEDVVELIADCREGTDRITKIVMDLKDFAHPGEEKIQSADINAGLESTLNVVNNEIKYKATVIKDYGEIPTVAGYPQQLNQVFMNILVNAAQAIEKQGEIHIRTRSRNGHAQVMISDTGSGISQENIHKVFDPFFTTKEIGKGTGLGMNIAYNIIKKHNGTIDIQSEIGKGTTFIINIPAEKEI